MGHFDEAANRQRQAREDRIRRRVASTLLQVHTRAAKMSVKELARVLTQLGLSILDPGDQAELAHECIEALACGQQPHWDA